LVNGHREVEEEGDEEPGELKEEEEEEEGGGLEAGGSQADAEGEETESQNGEDDDVFGVLKPHEQINRAAKRKASEDEVGAQETQESGSVVVLRVCTRRRRVDLTHV
jgi:hypothetical protein